MENDYIKTTKVLNKDRTITFDAAALRAAGAQPDDVLEVQFRVLAKSGENR